MVYKAIHGPAFSAWIRGLRDQKGKAAIVRRILRLADGNFGNAKFIADGVSEMRIDSGPGYRIYYKRIGEIVFV